MKLKINKKQWEDMGKQAGWMKQSGRDFMDIYDSVRKPAVPQGGFHNTIDKKKVPPLVEDAPDLDALEREANGYASDKGHMLGNWSDDGKGTGHNQCLMCGKEVHVIVGSSPGEDIVGEAVTTDCSL